MGPNLMRWISILCTNRKACVIIEGTNTTNLFNLERGNAQGDTISPFLFNLGYQILLFKLDLSLQIEGTLRDFAEEANNFLVQQGRGEQVGNVDPKAYALADDCTLLVKPDTANLEQIIAILMHFTRISGLESNLEKTALMMVGDLEPVPDDIINLGFEIKDEITLLGTKIKRHGLCYDSNQEIILEKIRKQVNFWKRFGLSLPGRINIAKTFLYSQINYLGCILPFSEQGKNNMSAEIEKFVIGNLRIAKNRIYLSKSEGGLDLFKLDDFLGAQCCSWIRRCYKMDELWKREFFLHSNGNIFNVRKGHLNVQKNPILRNIAEHFEKFVFKFTVVNENFKKAFIFDNPTLTFDPNRQHYLKKTFFTDQEWENNEGRIKSLTMDMLVSNNGDFYDRGDFELLSGITISDLKFNKLRGLARTAVAKYKKLENSAKKTDTVQNFLMRIKRGSKRIRKIISDKRDMAVSSNILKFADLTETVIDADSSALLNTSWTFGYLENSTRTFIFKLHNNLLGLNSRVAHFVRGHPSSCTFCDISANPEYNSESTSHLFFDCIHVERVLLPFYDWIFSGEDPLPLNRSTFFVGFKTNLLPRKITLHLINLLVKKFLWDCKLRFYVPNLNCLKNWITDELTRIGHQKPQMKTVFEMSNLFGNEIRF